MIFSNACCFKLYECLFTVSVVDRHFSFPYFENCGDIVPLCVVTSICGRGDTKINVVAMW